MIRAARRRQVAALHDEIDRLRAALRKIAACGDCGEYSHCIDAIETAKAALDLDHGRE